MLELARIVSDADSKRFTEAVAALEIDDTSTLIFSGYCFTFG
jgi:hypothetical protein